MLNKRQCILRRYPNCLSDIGEEIIEMSTQPNAKAVKWLLQ